MSQKNTLTKKFIYDNLASLYAAQVQPLLPLQKSLLESIVITCETTLDVGCGTGIVSHAVPICGYLGIDESPFMIATAKEMNPYARFECKEWKSCSVKPFDLVIGQAYLHLFEPVEAATHLKKMLQVAQKRCFVTTTLHNTYWSGDLPKEGAEHISRFRVQHTQESWVSLMRSANPEKAFIVYVEKDTKDRKWLCTLFFNNDLPVELIRDIYQRNGYLQVYNFEKVANLLPTCNSILSCPHPKVLRYEVASGFDRAEGMVCFQAMQEVSNKMQQFLSALLKDYPIYFKDKLNVKQAGREPFPPHQDIAAGWLKYATEHYTVALALQSCNKESGALEVVSLPVAEQKVLDGPNPLQPNDYHKEWFANKTWTRLDMQPGDIVIFSSKLVHQSGKNNSNDSRMIWLVSFVTNVIDKEGLQNFLQEKLKRQPTMDCGVSKDAPRDAFGKIL